MLILFLMPKLDALNYFHTKKRNKKPFFIASIFKPQIVLKMILLKNHHFLTVQQFVQQTTDCKLFKAFQIK